MKRKRKEKEYSVNKRKRKEKKRNIYNNLVVLPSHDTTSLLSFLVLRIFTTYNMGQPYYPFLAHLLLSSL